LCEWLNGAYADVLQFVDPETDNETSIRDAFRHYKPTGMQERMVTLFTGLYAAAGVVTKQGGTRSKTRRSRQVRTSGRRRLSAPTEMPSPGVELPANDRNPKKSGLPAPILGLLDSLPANGESWTQQRRDSFMRTFEAVIDFCFPVAGNANDRPKGRSEVGEGRTSPGGA
jgi:hypothetical protein